MKTHTIRRILQESLPILIIVLIFALITGGFLDTFLDDLLPAYPFILLIVPAFIDITGDLSGVVGARVTTHLYKGELNDQFRPYRLLSANLMGVLLVSFTAYAFLGFMIFGFSFIMPGFFPYPQLRLPFIGGVIFAGVTATACTSFIGLFAARIVYRSGRDPDSIIPPITTTVGDLLGILFVTVTLLSLAAFFTPFIPH
jgi:mgtE-like transporter